MTVTQPPATLPPEPGGEARHTSSVAKIVAVTLAVVAAAIIGYLVGSHQHAGGHVLVGRAYVSPYQAAVKVNGWVYGFNISADGMEWYDARGGSHDGGIPPCLRHPGHAWIRFGWSTAHGLHNVESWRSVDWVQCVPDQP